MRTLKLAGTRTAACLLLSCVAVPASAQQAGSTVPASSQDQLTIERVKNSFVVAPDFKVTTIDDRFSKLVGAYAGWVSDDTLLLGGGGYWLANQSRDVKMAEGNDGKPRVSVRRRLLRSVMLFSHDRVKTSVRVGRLLL